MERSLILSTFRDLEYLNNELGDLKAYYSLEIFYTGLLRGAMDISM